MAPVEVTYLCCQYLFNTSHGRYLYQVSISLLQVICMQLGYKPLFMQKEICIQRSDLQLLKHPGYNEWFWEGLYRGWFRRETAETDITLDVYVICSHVPVKPSLKAALCIQQIILEFFYGKIRFLHHSPDAN